MSKVKSSYSIIFGIICSIILVFYQANNTWVSINESENVTGCDSYGYARQAQLFREATNPIKGLDTSIKGELQDIFYKWSLETKLPKVEWYQMIAPHAHHFRVSTGKTINQYPPGAGWLLSHLPEYKARRTLWIICYSLITIMFINNIRNSNSKFTSILCMLMGMGSLYITNTFVNRSDSIGPSCIIAILLSSLTTKSIYKIKERSLPCLKEIVLMGLLIGISMSLRPGNLILIIMPLSLLWIILRKNYYSLKKAVLGFGISSIFSLTPFFVANKINTGSFFSTTYSSIDTNFDSSRFISNLLMVGESSEDSIRIIIVVMASMLFSIRLWKITLSKKGNEELKIVMIFSWFGMIMMTILMCLKPVYNLYYLAPQLVMLMNAISSISIIGSGSSMTRRRSFGSKWNSIYCCAILIPLIGTMYMQPVKLETSPLKITDSSIVWASGLGSELNYYYKINTAKLDFGTERARQEIIAYLSLRGVNQYILDDESDIFKNFQEVANGKYIKISKYKGRKIYKYLPKKEK